MSLRLISKKTQDSAELDERMIPVIMCAEGDGDPADDGDNEDDEPDDEDEDDSDKESGKSKSKDEESELQKVTRRMKAADRRAAEAERKIREAEDKDKSELELKTRRVEELETDNLKLQGQLKTLTQERHFLGSNTVTWHDPEIAMQKLDWEDIVDEDGEVDKAKLDRSIKDLAKAKPFLVKSESDGDTRDSGRNQSSGARVGSGKKQTKQELDRESLLKRFPALR